MNPTRRPNAASTGYLSGRRPPQYQEAHFSPLRRVSWCWHSELELDFWQQPIRSGDHNFLDEMDPNSQEEMPGSPPILPWVDRRLGANSGISSLPLNPFTAETDSLINWKTWNSVRSCWNPVRWVFIGKIWISSFFEYQCQGVPATRGKLGVFPFFHRIAVSIERVNTQVKGNVRPALSALVIYTAKLLLFRGTLGDGANLDHWVKHCW